MYDQNQDQQELIKRLLQGRGMRGSMPGMEWWRRIQQQAPIQNILKVGINRPQQGGSPLGVIGNIISRGGGGELPMPGRTINIGDIIRNLPGGGIPNLPPGGIPNRRPMM